MLGGNEDAGGVVDAHRGVARGVEHHERFPQPGNGGLQVLRRDVLEELLLDAERPADQRSEEHTSELQSLMRISYAVFCLKKKKRKQTQTARKTANITSRVN